MGIDFPSLAVLQQMWQKCGLSFPLAPIHWFIFVRPCAPYGPVADCVVLVIDT